MKTVVFLALVGFLLAIGATNFETVPGTLDILQLVGGLVLMIPLTLVMAWGFSE